MPGRVSERSERGSWHFTVALALALAAAGGCHGGAPAPAQPAATARLTAKDIVQRSSPAIVQIEAGNEKRGTGFVGTGFVVDKLGIIATNLHVVAGESSIRVKMLDGSQYPVTVIAGVDPARDLALLQIQPTKELPVLRLGDSDLISAGDQIVAIGNPLGFNYSVTSGLVSQVRPVCGQAEIASGAQGCKQELKVLQISAPISPGSSGGPLFNQAGEVVGITTAIVTAGQNLNLAVPGNYLKPLIAHHEPIPTDRFAQETQSAAEEAGGHGGEDEGAEIIRRVPVLEAATYDGCNVDDISEIVRQIGETIENGAPIYNAGNHEACFRIYEGTAIKLEHDAACKGVRTAFGDGLLRVNGLKTYKEKAWAMRDTFDGLIEAARKWAHKHPEAVQGQGQGPAKGGKPAKPKP
ncbi:MAG TPA: S1C family serine protease [Kofleriaceae bacterium]|nr:S1C family serine protease [Kofleriaceae bacterium]